MSEELINQIGKVIESNGKYRDIRRELKTYEAKLWLKTDWETKLDKKKPTVKDKESAIILDPYYQELSCKKDDYKKEMEYENMILDMLMLEGEGL